MNFTSNRNVLRWVIILFSITVTALILWNTYQFFLQLKESERKNMVEYGLAVRDLDSQPLDVDISELVLAVSQNATTIPMIKIDYKGIIDVRNLPDEIKVDSVKRNKLIEEFAKQNEPLEVTFNGEPLTTIYYGESPIIKKMKYFPLALVLILFLFTALIWFYYRSTKASEQNKLWAGMAKESAHQIGTPLSSLVGWTTLLKDTDVDPSYVVENGKRH